MSDPDSAYAWRLAGALMLVLTLGSGFVFYNLSVYVNLLSTERGFSVTSMSGAITVMFLVGAPVGILIGRLIQSHDVRIIMLAGSVVGGGALVALGSAQTLWQIYLIYVLLGIGYSCVSLIPVTTLVARWFDDASRPIAMSFTSTGLSLGGVIFTPLTVWLVASWSFESAMLVIGVLFALCIAPIAWFAVRPWPPGARPASNDSAAETDSYRRIARSRFFIGVTAAYFVTMAAQVGGLTHLFNRAADLMDAIDASFAVSILGIASIVGRLSGGWIVTRLPMRGFIVGNLVGQTAGLLVIAMAASRGELWFGAALFGVTIGNLLMLQPLLIAQAFEIRHFPRLYSLSQSFSGVGVAFGPLLLGWVHDRADYTVSFVVAAVGSLVAVLMLLASGAAPTRQHAGDDHQQPEN